MLSPELAIKNMQRNVFKEERAIGDRRGNHKQAYKYAVFKMQSRFLFSF